jgi:predicted AlkP superfamily pyrophosphatase or phosphodiesterase
MVRYKQNISVSHVIACLDGFDSAYLAATETPGWDRVATQGNEGICKGLVPSLTNVNNAGIITGSFPERNGVGGVACDGVADPVSVSIP